MPSKLAYPLALLASLSLVAGCGSSGSSTTTPPPAAPAATVTPSVYVETNALSGNAVVGYSRNTDGSLSVIGTYPTGANGVGLPTAPGALPFPIGGATGAVRLSPDGTHLYAVDAGSADVAAFTVAADGSLTLIARYPTGGTSPGSITIDSGDQYLYVLNTGSVPDASNTPGSITGFSIASDGSLTALANSTQPLSSATAYVDPSQVNFSPDGTYLVVTEKQPGATGMIDIYPLTAGVAGKPVSSPSAGNIPFGFGFTPTGTLVVVNAEAADGSDTATVSSYTATAAGAVTPISSRVPDLQAAACWVSITSTGNYAYASNTLSGSVSGYAISSTGALSLITSSGITAAQSATTGPIDITVAPGDAFLYVLDSYAGASPGTLAAFSIASDGSLTSVPSNVTGLLPGSIGLAIR